MNFFLGYRESEYNRVLELSRLCSRVSADGRLSDDEVLEVLQWLDQNHDIANPEVQRLVALSREIIADKRVTREERASLLKAMQSLACQPIDQSALPSQADNSAWMYPPACESGGSASDVISAAATSPVPSPATERQKEFARGLGIVFHDTIDKTTISNLIESTLLHRETERIARLRAIADKEDEIKAEFRDSIIAEHEAENPSLKNATPFQMLEALAARKLGAILITFCGDEVGDDGELSGVEFTVAHNDNIDAVEMRKILLMLAMKLNS